jgi:Ca-activated chloride channel family protein
MNASLKLDELASSAGVSPRTVRYYIQRELLPAPEFRGPDTNYDERHLCALRAIRALQDAYWPLDAIAAALHGKSLAALREIAEGKQLPGGKAFAAPAAEPATTRVDAAAGTRGIRHLLAPGLELWLDELASEAVRELADRIRELAAKSRPGKRRS